MSTAAGAARASDLPPAVRLASVLLLGVSALLAVTGVVLGVARGYVATQSYPDAAEQSLRDELSGSLLVVALVFVVLAVFSVMVGLGLRRRRVWARAGGLAVGILLGVLGAQLLLAAGGNPVALLLPVGALGIAVTVVASLLNRDATDWFAGGRGSST